MIDLQGIIRRATIRPSVTAPPRPWPTPLPPRVVEDVPLRHPVRRSGDQQPSIAWTNIEVARLEDLLRKGFGPTQIARTLTRTVGSVSAKMSLLGLKAKARKRKLLPGKMRGGR